MLYRLTVLGEAAGRLTDDFRASHPQIAWREIIGQRHVVVHQYDQVSLPRIWALQHEQLPALIAFLTPLVNAALAELEGPGE